jgi:RimJ/RimL family protein N-acetyltransferase
MDKPTLQGEMIVLRPVGRQDVDAMWEIVTDPEARRMAGTTRDWAREDVARWIAGVGAADERIDLAVTANGSDEYLGEILLEGIDPVVRSAALRLTMRPAYRGRGYGTEAILLVLGMAFDGLGLHRVGALVPAINARAKSLYENLGFRVEGRLRDSFRDGEGWTDGLVMGLLEDEYRASQLPASTPERA